MDLQCKKCLTSRTGDVLGAACKTAGCDGVIEEVPAFGTLVDVLPEPMTCGQRSESFALGAHEVGTDRWLRFKSNGNRVCSYCGSLHPEDMFALVRESANAPSDARFGSVVEIEPSTKAYKIYVQQPGVRNAMEGGIKFYTHHLPRDENGTLAVTEEQQVEYSRAIGASQKRFERAFV